LVFPGRLVCEKVDEPRKKKKTRPVEMERCVGGKKGFIAAGDKRLPGGKIGERHERGFLGDAINPLTPLKNKASVQRGGEVGTHALAQGRE